MSLQGELTGEHLPGCIGEWLEEHYRDEGLRHIRMDLRSIDYSDLEGVAALILLQRQAKDRGKRFTVEGACGQVLDKLRVTGVLDLLEGRCRPSD